MKTDITEIKSFKKDLSETDKTYALNNNGYIVTILKKNFLVTSRKSGKGSEIITNYEVKCLDEKKDKMYIDHHRSESGKVSLQAKIGSTPIIGNNELIKYLFLTIDPYYEKYTANPEEDRQTQKEDQSQQINPTLKKFLSVKK